MNKLFKTLLITISFLLTIICSSFVTYAICKNNFYRIEYVTVVEEKEIIVEKTPKEYMNGYYSSPVDEPVWITSTVGPRNMSITNETFHRGDDLATSTRNANIRAAAAGIVVENWPAPNGYFRGHPIYGGYTIIKHDNGTYTTYAHMSNVFVKEGQKVAKGEVIGIMGSTGISTGTHLHFEIIITPSKWIDI